VPKQSHPECNSKKYHSPIIDGYLHELGHAKAREKPENKKATPKDGLNEVIYWCPRAESNHDLMITNQIFMSFLTFHLD